MKLCFKKILIKTIGISSVSLALTGCTSTYNRQILKAPGERLQADHSVVIQTPRDGQYGAQKYARSGEMTADAFREGFLRYSSDVKFAKAEQSKTEYSGQSNMYFAEPVILHWEDRATEWSGKPDRIEIKLNVYDTRSMELLSSAMLSGKSKWATFGGDHPQDLLQKPIKEYLDTLYSDQREP